MPEPARMLFAAALAAAVATLGSAAALAQSKGGGKIICWKDKTGKVLGCGDRVPPEFEDSATKELDRRGVVRKTTGTAEEEARRAAEQEELSKRKAAEKKRLAEQSRRDAALLGTYAHEKEIDQRRDRELQAVDGQIRQLQALQKNAAARVIDAQTKAEAAEKAGRPSDVLNDEAARARGDLTKIERNIAGKEKEKEEIRARYAETKKRYVELRGGGARAAAATKK